MNKITVNVYPNLDENSYMARNGSYDLTMPFIRH
jgi:hypothetical protein